MGSITCAGKVVEFDDPLLAHLQIVIVQKFRAREAFLMSWLDAASTGDGRSAMWLTPDAPVHFKFVGSRSPEIDREWLDVLSRAASSGPGLIVTDKHGVLARSTGQHDVGRPH
ncbi:MAG: hypothetical protein QOE37_2089 [Microbacteriaceae bacterium]|nr:hypothetical protein [Microbacteriaceae bacterium]